MFMDLVKKNLSQNPFNTIVNIVNDIYDESVIVISNSIKNVLDHLCKTIVHVGPAL